MKSEKLVDRKRMSSTPIWRLKNRKHDTGFLCDTKSTKAHKTFNLQFRLESTLIPSINCDNVARPEAPSSCVNLDCTFRIRNFLHRRDAWKWKTFCVIRSTTSLRMLHPKKATWGQACALINRFVIHVPTHTIAILVPITSHIIGSSLTNSNPTFIRRRAIPSVVFKVNLMIAISRTGIIRHVDAALGNMTPISRFCTITASASIPTLRVL